MWHKMVYLLAAIRCDCGFLQTTTDVLFAQSPTTQPSEERKRIAFFAVEHIDLGNLLFSRRKGLAKEALLIHARAAIVDDWPGVTQHAKSICLFYTPKEEQKPSATCN